MANSFAEQMAALSDAVLNDTKVFQQRAKDLSAAALRMMEGDCSELDSLMEGYYAELNSESGAGSGGEGAEEEAGSQELGDDRSGEGNQGGSEVQPRDSSTDAGWRIPDRPIMPE